MWRTTSRYQSFPEADQIDVLAACDHIKLALKLLWSFEFWM